MSRKPSFPDTGYAIRDNRIAIGRGPVLHSLNLDTHRTIDTEANSSATARLALPDEKVWLYLRGWNYLEKLHRLVRRFAAGAPS